MNKKAMSKEQKAFLLKILSEKAYSDEDIVTLSRLFGLNSEPIIINREKAPSDE